MLNLTDTAQPNNSNTPTLRPMGFGEVLDTTFSLYRQHFPLFLHIIAIDFFGSLVEYLLWRFLPNFPLKGIVTTLIGMPFGLVSMGGIIVATATVYLGKRIRSSDALKQAGHRFWHLSACHLLWNLVFGIPRIGIIFLPISIFMSSTDFMLSTESIPFLFLFTITLLVSIPFSIHLPINLWNRISRLMTSVMIEQMWIRFIPLALAPFSLYFTVRWMFAPVVVLLEKPLIRRAFGRSNELTRGKWWQVWGMLISFAVLSFAIRRIVMIFVAFILILTKLAGAANPLDILKWFVRYTPIDNINPLFYTIMSWTGSVVGTLIFPIWVIGITLVYLDLRIRKEGIDIEIQLNDSATMAT